MSALNNPALVAEIEVLHDAYERALAAHDVPALNAFFWDSPDVVRFGVAEHLYGAAAIASYRQGAGPAFTDRQLLRRTITTFGTDTASVMCELSQRIADQPRHGRQSQLWIRLPEVGWKIVAAHVSNAPSAAPASPSWEAYAERTAAALGLPIDPAHLPGVVLNLTRSAAIAAPFLAIALPDDVEPAPVFTA